MGPFWPRWAKMTQQYTVWLVNLNSDPVMSPKPMLIVNFSEQQCIIVPILETIVKIQFGITLVLSAGKELLTSMITLII